jgi:hypothetical protein
MCGQRHAPAALPPGMTRYPLYRRLGGLQGRSGRVGKPRPYRHLITGPSEVDTDCAVTTHYVPYLNKFNMDCRFHIIRGMKALTIVVV